MHQSHKTRAGIDWTKDLRYGAAKILIGNHSVKLGQALFTKSYENELTQLVGDRMPEVLDCIHKDYDGNNTIGYLLSHRASYCLRPDQYKHGKNELERFQRQDFSSTWSAVIGTQETLSLVRLQDIQEQHILLNTPEGPGLYLRWNYDSPEYIYVGESKDHDDRNKGHFNSMLMLWKIYSTARVQDAKFIEKKCHDFLREIGEPVRDGTRGCFRVKKGENALQLTMNFLNKYYSGFFRNVGGPKL